MKLRFTVVGQAQWGEGELVPNCDSAHSCFWSFTSWQYLRSYQDEYRPMTAHTHGDFIVVPHYKTKTLAPWPDIPPSYPIELTSPSLLLIMLSTKHKLDKLLLWLDQEFELLTFHMGGLHSTYLATAYGHCPLNACNWIPRDHTTWCHSSSI